MIWRVRPAPVAWPFMALCCFWPPMVARIVAGNPVMWVMAAVALGFVVRWAFVGVLLKPSLFPFALLGVRDRSWWIALAIVDRGLAARSVRLWFDWVAAVTNSTGGGCSIHCRTSRSCSFPSSPRGCAERRREPDPRRPMTFRWC